MSLALYMSPVSQPSRAVNWYIAKNKIEGIEIKTVDMMKGEFLSPEYTAITPFQAVPALRIDDKETLSESGAIMLYLASKNGNADLPEAGSLEYCKAFEALMYHGGTARLITTKWFRFVVLPKFMNPKEHTLAKAKAATTESQEEIKWVLNVLDTRLGKNGGFSAGSTFSLPDYLLAAELTQINVLKCAWPEGFSMDAYTNINKFLEDIKSIEGYAQFVAPLAMVQGVMDAPWAE